ncbi:MAG: hypothetical protein KAQ68_00745 [Clostridiales bacterium]|nr:hypothetical protein [Clostridiales bacterium]
MNVVMLIHTGHSGRKISPGDILDVADILAQRWVEEGIAKMVKEPEKKVEVKPVAKKASTSKKVVQKKTIKK